MVDAKAKTSNTYDGKNGTRWCFNTIERTFTTLVSVAKDKRTILDLSAQVLREDLSLRFADDREKERITAETNKSERTVLTRTPSSKHGVESNGLR